MADSYRLPWPAGADGVLLILYRQGAEGFVNVAEIPLPAPADCISCAIENAAARAGSGASSAMFRIEAAIPAQCRGSAGHYLACEVLAALAACRVSAAAQPSPSRTTPIWNAADTSGMRRMDSS